MLLINKILSKKNLIKFSLILALLLCLVDMPYWYFQLVRIFGTIGFAYLSYIDYKGGLKYTPYVFGVAAILLNPIIKISFGREMWNVVDVVLAVLLLMTIILQNKLKN